MVTRRFDRRKLESADRIGRQRLLFEGGQEHEGPIWRDTIGGGSLAGRDSVDYADWKVAVSQWFSGG